MTTLLFDFNICTSKSSSCPLEAALLTTDSELTEADLSSVESGKILHLRHLSRSKGQPFEILQCKFGADIGPEMERFS